MKGEERKEGREGRPGKRERDRGIWEIGGKREGRFSCRRCFDETGEENRKEYVEDEEEEEEDEEEDEDGKGDRNGGRGTGGKG